VKQEVYNKLKKIVVKEAKEEHLFFTIAMGLLMAYLLIISLLETSDNFLIKILIAMCITIFSYVTFGQHLQKKIKEREELMKELEKDVE
jgi:uncharacterized protein YacL